MPSIRIPLFGGLNRAKDARHLTRAEATIAHNTELRDGTLMPFRTPKLEKTADFEVKTVVELPHNDACCTSLLCFDHCATVTYPMDPGCEGNTQAVIWHENGNKPERYICETGETFPVVVPKPVMQATAARTAAGTLEDDLNCGPDQRSYTYTWVDQFGVETPPAPPATPALSYDDETWEVTIPETPPANAACVRIYRTTAEFSGGADPSQQGSTSWQLVEEIPISAFGGRVLDDKCLLDLCFGTLQTMYDCPCPECLEDVQETDEGYHVGFVGQDLWFSERHEPHNWPERYRTTLPFKIQGIAVNNNIVYVGTAGNPYLVRTGVTDDPVTGDVILRIDPTKYDQRYPMYGKRTITATAWGATYVSREGMVALQPSLPARIFTRQTIDEDLWYQHIPNRIAWHNGRLYGSRAPSGKGFIMDIRGEPEGPRDLGELVTIDINACDIHSGFSGRLLYAQDSEVLAWDEGKERLRYCWKSKRYVLPGRLAFNAMKVVGAFGAPVEMILWCDGAPVFRREVADDCPFRLPRYGKGLDYEVEVKGTTKVHEVHVATSMYELLERETS